MVPEPIRKIYYNSWADENVYNMIREVMPPGFKLVALDSDNDAERRLKIADAQVAIVAATPLTRTLIEAAHKLQLVLHQGVGYQDTVDVAALKERRLALALTPEGTTTPVAEITIFLMLAVLRRLTFADSELRQGRWHINSLRPVSRNLKGRVIGYIGMGRIGQATAALAQAFGATGLYCDLLETIDPQSAAALDLRFRENGMNCIAKTGQAIHTSDKDILNASILQVCDHTEPEIGPFSAIRDPMTENIPVSIQVNTQYDVDCRVGHLAIPSQLDVDRIHIDDRIDGS